MQAAEEEAAKFNFGIQAHRQLKMTRDNLQKNPF
jgi:hypothetical protein